MPYYTVESRYNGKLFRFNVYSGKVESLIPALNLAKRIENPFIEFKASTTDAGHSNKVYYEPTDLKNGVTITIEAKKHHRTSYIDAVKSQLLYFDNIQLLVKKEEGNTIHIDHKAEIFFENDQIILSDNSYWAKPHLLINKVNYGFIDFDELELEDKVGNIGIKVEPELVSINPSRESIIWDEQTKNLILSKFKTVVTTATKLIQEELKETDFIRWLRICYQIATRYHNNASSSSVINRLTGIIDLSEIEPVFPGTKIRFTTDLFNGFKVRKVTLKEDKKANRITRKVDREEIKTGFSSVIHLPMFLSTDSASFRKDKYLLHTLYPDGYLLINPPFWLETSFEKLDLEKFKDKASAELQVSGDKAVEVYEKIKSSTATILELLEKSQEVLNYKDIEVPEDFNTSDEEEDEEELTEEEKVEKDVYNMSTAERRKLQGKTIVHTPRVVFDFPNGATVKQLYEWQKIELPIIEINSWKEEEIFYGFDADAKKIEIAAFLTRPLSKNDTDIREGHTYRSMDSWADSKGLVLDPNNVNSSEAIRCAHYYDNKLLKLVKVAAANSKFYRDFKHIEKFFIDIKNGKVTMASALIKWNTSRQIKQRLQQLSFLYNFPFDLEKQNTFRNLCAYVQANYREVGEPAKNGTYKHMTDDSYKDLIGHLDKVQQFQMFVKNCEDAEQIKALAIEIWDNDAIKDGEAIDLELWNQFISLLEWSTPVHTILNNVPKLTGIVEEFDASQLFDEFETRNETKLDAELEQEIYRYLKERNVIL